MRVKEFHRSDGQLALLARTASCRCCRRLVALDGEGRSFDPPSAGERERAIAALDWEVGCQQRFTSGPTGPVHHCPPPLSPGLVAAMARQFAELADGEHEAELMTALVRLVARNSAADVDRVLASLGLVDLAGQPDSAAQDGPGRAAGEHAEDRVVVEIAASWDLPGASGREVGDGA